MEKRQIRVMRISPATLGLFEGAFGLLMGLAIGIGAWISATAGFNLNTGTVLEGLALGMTPGIGAIVALGVIYFALGWVAGVVHGAAFNLLTAWLGGLEVASQALDRDEVQEAEALEALEAYEAYEQLEEPEVTPMPSGRQGVPAFGESIRQPKRRL